MVEARQAPNARRVLVLLFLANMLNIFDRAIPAIVAEPMRKEWGLTDFQFGIIIAAFAVVFAGVAVPLGRLADNGSRKVIIGCGLVVWSAFTALGATAWSFGSFVATRVGVGLGEASCVPAASALIGDMFPANKRSRAMGIFALGVPVGLLLAFFGVGAIVKVFDSWRAPFVVAMIPGLVIAAMIFMVREPARGASETVQPDRDARIQNPVRKIASIRTMWWIVAAGVTSNFAAYATNSFMVPLLQRYFGLFLETAAISTGVIVGLTGIVGLVLGGRIADRLYERSERGRLMMGGACLAFAAGATWCALALGTEQIWLFITLFSLGWLTQYAFQVCVLPSMHDVVEPRLRATAMAMSVAAFSLIGGMLGPPLVGLLSDGYALHAMAAAGATEMTERFKAVGLHDAMRLVPLLLFATAIAILLAARSFPADAKAMMTGMRSNAQPLAPHDRLTSADSSRSN